MEVVKKERVIAYIDGYNLYYGLKDSGYKCYLWLNIQALVQALLLPQQELVGVRYFTTLVTNNVDTRLRQKCFINALNTLNLVKIFYGKFQKEDAHCNDCGHDYQTTCEKMTDVGIATEMMKDYYEDNFDMAMLISGDTDLLPPIKFINENSKNKRVFVAFPPNRVNDEVRKFAKGSMTIGRKNLKDSQFPNVVASLDGTEQFTKPETWV